PARRELLRRVVHAVHHRDARLRGRPPGARRPSAVRGPQLRRHARAGARDRRAHRRHLLRRSRRQRRGVRRREGLSDAHHGVHPGRRHGGRHALDGDERRPAARRHPQGARRHVIDGDFSYAFGLGLVATVNPCGFAMLPAYLGYFLGLEGHDDPDRSVLRALAVGATLTAGFVAVFAVIGLIIEHVSRAVMDAIPYATVVIGVALVVLAIAML